MTWDLEMENIAGIRQGAAELHEGTNAVRASNWQGKSSFLAALRTAMGCDDALTEGENEGYVELTDDEGTIRVSLQRNGEAVRTSGSPYLDDEYDRTCASLFAFLDGRNEVRRAVQSRKDLEPLLTRPLDLEEIDREIADRRAERDRIDREMERAHEKANRLPSLQQKVTSLEGELEELREREANLVDARGDGGEEAREELSDLRAERERVRNIVDRLENSIDRTEKKLEDVYDEREELDVPDDPDVESDIAEAKSDLEDLERDQELLQSMYSATERVLEEDRVDLLSEVDHGLMGDTLECLVCGSEVTEDAVRERLDALGDRVVDRREAVQECSDRVEALQERRDEIREARRRRDDLERRITNLESDLAEREENLSGAYERLDTIGERVKGLESQVEETDEELTDVRSEIKYEEAELEEVSEEIAECERATDQVDVLEEQRAAISDEITDLRERKERLRGQLREEFDAAIEEVVERFDTSFEGARLTSTFDLVVARNGREVSLDALSEGERELLGIVTALAGFETYDVAERTPAILVDEVGGLADRNLSRLVEYLEDRPRFLVVTAYPENSAFENNEVTPREWDIVAQSRA